MNALAMPSSSTSGLTVAELTRELAPFGARLRGSGEVRVQGARQDSRRVEPGDLFCVRAGGKTSGALYVEDAVRRGARALLVDAACSLPAVTLPVIEVSDARAALGFAAEAIYGYPSRALPVVGITGTNGKTTTSFLVEHALDQLGQRPARLGTLGLSFDGQEYEGSLTTPEADDLSRAMSAVRAAGATQFVMEVSSHALELGRVAALAFRVGALTNLTQDHLDFHGTLASYGEAKARLFREFELDASVINVGDSFGAELARTARGRVLTVARRGSADVSAAEVVVDARGIHGLVSTPEGAVELNSGLVGEHNLENLLVALGILHALGFSYRSAAAALERAPQVPGRLERCDAPGDDIAVFVDYAHTPDALERVLSALARVSSGELWCVFGCGGDRDPSKRPKMGAAVAGAATRAIITSDNPRSEDPGAIVAAIEPPMRESGRPYLTELDRARAIERAILEAPSGATVLLAGKGHEPYQIIGEVKRPFDDRVEARRALELRRRQRSSQ